MYAIVVRDHGSPEVLRQETWADKTPGPGEVQVQVRACGINHLDLWIRRGLKSSSLALPRILGSDVAGTVLAVGAGVKDIQPHTDVVIAPGISCGVCKSCWLGQDHCCPHYGILGECCHGGYAQQVVVPRRNIILKPPQLSFEEAAGLGIPFLTAWHMLKVRTQLQWAETVLVHAAGSGVGSAAIQIAKLSGAYVIATASTEAKRQQALAWGADEVLNSQAEGLDRQVKALTEGRGVDVVFEHVGEATWQTSLRCLAWQGRLVTCGATTGSRGRVDLNHLFRKSLSLLGSTMGSQGELVTVLEHAACRRLRAVIDRVMPLSRIQEAHALLEARHIFGKIVVTPPDAHNVS